MKRWLTASMLLTLGILAGGEVIVRVFFARSMTGRFEYGYHPTAGFVENADGTVHLVRAGGRRFRPQTFSKARPPGTFRAMVIGDSVPRGPDLAASYPFLLGEKMRDLGMKAESFNLALGGNGAQRSQIILRKALDYEPSLVILHVNNSNEYEDEREYKRAQEFKSWHPRNWLMKSLLIRRSYEAKTEQVFWKWLPVVVRNVAAVSDTDAEVWASQNPEKLRAWDDRVRRYTTESVALARARGVPVLLLTQASRELDDAGRASLDNHGLDDLVRPFIGAGVYHLSMKQILEGPECASLFADSAHLRPEGHRLLAVAIVEKLRQEGVITISE